MFMGKLVKFQVPCIAKFCSSEGSSDFIIEHPLTGVVLKDYTDVWGSPLLEIFAAGEILFDVEHDDVQIIREG